MLRTLLEHLRLSFFFFVIGPAWLPELICNFIMLLAHLLNTIFGLLSHES